MKQVIQNIRNGELSVATVPSPIVQAEHVLIANAHSVISAGTERMTIELAKKSLLGKARERPDHVRRVIQKLRQEGFFTTLAQVMEKLDEPMTLGYSSAGVVLASGSGVRGIKVGDRVASNGPHAGVVCVPKHLCALVPDGVKLEDASFAVLGAIALQGVRLARLGLGETVFVIGLGLVGQLTVALLKAHGCRVVGTDVDPARCALASRLGADIARTGVTPDDVHRATGGLGADAVIVAASTPSDGPIALAGDSVREKGRVVVVGAVGMNIPRAVFYHKEAELVVSRSYGPGRYDPNYESRGRDYPAPHVRWTEQRNLSAVLDLMASGKLDVSSLITHRFEIEQAVTAYELIEQCKEPSLGVLFSYPGHEGTALRRTELTPRAKASGSDRVDVGCIGVGNFARMVMLPAVVGCRTLRPRILCSARGLSAVTSAEKLGFELATTDEEEVYRDDRVRAVFIMTPHHLHATQVIRALEAGKHVFVEKPLVLSLDELARVEQALAAAKGLLVMVGFNRRFSPAAAHVMEFFKSVEEPRTISIRFNAGELPADHWTQDDEIGGGRIIGEACHAIDLATLFAGSPPVRVFAESVGGPRAPQIADDHCFMTLRHANGSVSSIAYLAGGDKAFPKERIEVFGGGRVAVIDDFREVVTCVQGRRRRVRAWRQDKGHRAEIDAFARALAGGSSSPTPWPDVRAVTVASVLATRSLKEGVPLEVV
jgi:predicted dehydrogenase/threonine dehydrogenase-like Zn-dependent dehydrogenase